MKVVLLLSVLMVAVFAAEFTTEQLSAWKEYKTKFNKEYTPEEDKTRLQIYLQTDELIKTHNARFANGQESSTLGHNQFSDQKPEEIPKGIAKT